MQQNPRDKKKDRERLLRYRAFAEKRGLSDEDADDFAQEAFIRFWKAGENAELRLSFVFADFLRGTRGRIGTTRNSVEHLSLDAPFSADSPENNLYEIIPSQEIVVFTEGMIDRLEREAKARRYMGCRWRRNFSAFLGIAISDLQDYLRERIKK